MSNDDASPTIPPFHSLPFSAYYRTECQDKYCTSRLAYHVANDNECASSYLLTPCFDKDPGSGTMPNDTNSNTTKNTNNNNTNTNYNYNSYRPSYRCQALVHGHQYSRKVRCFDQWVDAAGFANAALSDIARKMAGQRTLPGEQRQQHASKA
uniref:Uncharacterized protein n=1 Tax=Pseudo-nitzschia australis TaxID=44445 RepID=A0A7S4ASE6_9STRA